MWAELLPRLVGGTLVDHDAPNAPTEIVGFELTETFVTIKGRDFSFGGKREYTGIGPGAAPNTFAIHSAFGMGATVTTPTVEQQMAKAASNRMFEELDQEQESE